MEEKIFFEQGNVKVTNARFIVDNQTYAINGVTSIKAEVSNPPTKGYWIAIAIGVLMLGGEMTFKLIGVLLAGITGWLLYSLKSTNWVVLHSASGEQRAYSSKDEPHIKAIVNALNDALIHRG